MRKQSRKLPPKPQVDDNKIIKYKNQESLIPELLLFLYLLFTMFILDY